MHKLKEQIVCFFKTTLKDFLSLNQIDPSWLTVWTIIYLSFLTIDLFVVDFWFSSALKYLGILLCLIYAHQKAPKDWQLFCALLFTFFADTILVWTKYEFLGVMVFCIAQFFHTYRLTGDSHKSHFALYVMSLITIYFFARLFGVESLYAITAIYAFELLLNAFIARENYFTRHEDPHARCAFYGYILFLGCDLCVGLRHLILDGLLPQQFLPLIAFMVWVFYYPSQVLLSNSSTIQQKVKRTAQIKPNKIAK